MSRPRAHGGLGPGYVRGEPEAPAMSGRMEDC